MKSITNSANTNKLKSFVLKVKTEPYWAASLVPLAIIVAAWLAVSVHIIIPALIATLLIGQTVLHSTYRVIKN